MGALLGPSWSPTSVACMPMPAEMPRPAAHAAEEPPLPGQRREQVHFGAPPRTNSLQGLLQVSGSAAPVAPLPAATSGAAPLQELQDLLSRGWESSDGEEDDAAAALSEGEEAFHYSRYRYRDVAAAQAAECPRPAERHRRGQPNPLRGAQGDARGSGGDPSDDESCSSPWRRCRSPCPAARALVGWSPARAVCSTPVCEEEGQQQEEDQLRRLADALVKFYGLPGAGAVRLKPNTANLVFVDERAWAERQRRGQLDEPPMMWIRGGRVYDFHGDRGTLEEVEHDLLVRQVEDDPGIRDRRRAQGLMPFPFVAVPLKGHWDLEAEDERPPPLGGAPRPENKAEAARRRHWLSA